MAGIGPEARDTTAGGAECGSGASELYDSELQPRALLEDIDDATAVEASLIENIPLLGPNDVSHPNSLAANNK